MVTATLPSNLDDGEDIRAIELHRKTENEKFERRYRTMDQIKQSMYFSMLLLLDVAMDSEEQSLRMTY